MACRSARTLRTRRHLLAKAALDATIAWDKAEACELPEAAPFDLILIGNHPTELDGATILDGFSFRGIYPPF